MSDSLKQAALDYHEKPVPGKLETALTKPADTPGDLSLAYSPGVAEPVKEIAANAQNAYKYTGKGNLVAVVTNGSAILGLGNLGPLASKPVMEGKSLLFKRFGNVNSVDIEVDAQDPCDFISTVKRIACSFGGINLEDIKAPDCFQIESELSKHCDIPVFHDDQHGTAIVVLAGLMNALEVQEKLLADVEIVCLGAGAAAIACCNLLIDGGADPARITMIDSKGVVHSERDNLNDYKRKFAKKTSKRTLGDAMTNADVVIGLSGADLISAEQLISMAEKPIVFACSNPDPEISPDLAKKAREDLILATGRSDYPNQVNNVLCFPYIFRGALDVQAREINLTMKLAAVDAIRQLAKQAVPTKIKEAYGDPDLSFGPNYILPKPIDERLLAQVPNAVANAAIETGVASVLSSSETLKSQQIL